jgi:hypothetical protein
VKAAGLATAALGALPLSAAAAAPAPESLSLEVSSFRCLSARPAPRLQRRSCTFSSFDKSFGLE